MTHHRVQHFTNAQNRRKSQLQQDELRTDSVTVIITKWRAVLSRLDGASVLLRKPTDSSPLHPAHHTTPHHTTQTGKYRTCPASLARNKMRAIRCNTCHQRLTGLSSYVQMLRTTAASDNGADMTSIQGWFPSPLGMLNYLPCPHSSQKGPGSSRIVDLIPSVPSQELAGSRWEPYEDRGGDAMQEPKSDSDCSYQIDYSTVE
jgi:hypothetical protein